MKKTPFIVILVFLLLTTGCSFYCNPVSSKLNEYLKSAYNIIPDRAGAPMSKLKIMKNQTEISLNKYVYRYDEEYDFYRLELPLDFFDNNYYIFVPYDDDMINTCTVLYPTGYTPKEGDINTVYNEQNTYLSLHIPPKLQALDIEIEVDLIDENNTSIGSIILFLVEKRG